MKVFNFLLLLLLVFLLCACTKNVHVEGGGTNRDATGAILIGTDF